VLDTLVERGLTLATAEATNGGLIGHLLTEVPGSSKAFRGGVAPYANHMKQQIGVPASVLNDHGAVSKEAAETLAFAVRSWAGADIALAETGIAGPTGAGPDRPAGLFFIAVATKDGVTSERFFFDGARSENKLACAEAALQMLLEELRA
jgi:PncC family amidohydrolase